MFSTTLLRLMQVTERRGRSRSQIYRDIQLGVMTPPVRAGSNISVWPDHEVQEINEAEVAGASTDELRALVQRLIQRRKQGRSMEGQTRGQATAA
jgi:prophage regulatory protein